MKYLTRVLPIAILLLAGCEVPADTSVAATMAVQQARADHPGNEIQRLNEVWLGYANAGDVDALVGLYAPDAVVITPEGLLRGHEEIRADFEENLEPDGTLTTDRIEVAQGGDLAYVYGSWASASGDRGSYLSVLGRRDSGWLWLADAWNIESAPAK